MFCTGCRVQPGWRKPLRLSFDNATTAYFLSSCSLSGVMRSKSLFRKTVVLPLLALIAASATAAWYFVGQLALPIERIATPVCAAKDGIWLAAEQRCQTPACVDEKNCVSSRANTQICNALPANISSRDLIFRLGQPTHSDGKTLYFTASPSEPGEIRAIIDASQHVTRLECEGYY
jgi:hypothetical protein